MKRHLITFGLLLTGIISLFFIFNGFKTDIKLTSEGHVNRFSYFTIQTNFLVAIWFLMLFFSRVTPPNVDKYLLNPLIGQAVTIYISITAIVYWVVLVPIYGTSFSCGNLWQHGFLALLAWYFYLAVIPKPGKEDRKKQQIVPLLIYPFGYMSYALINGIVTGNYIYPFLSPKFMGSVFIVFVAIILITVLFIFIAFILRRLAYK